MKGSFKLMRLWGIDVYVHFTFLMMLAWEGYQSGFADGNWPAALRGMAFYVSLFLCVLLHEYGHALAARRFGIPTLDITLLPIGGIARLERIPNNPKQELIIALSGPLVNVIIAAGLFLGLKTGDRLAFFLSDVGHAFEQMSFLYRLLVINISLVLFNMLPAFPMDGGRVVRALLGLFLDPGRATRIAATIGKGMAVIFLLVALYTASPLLGVIAVFIWLEARGEAAASQSGRSGITPVKQAMLTEFQVLLVSDSLGQAAQRVMGNTQEAFPVVTPDNQVVGIVLARELSEALAREGEWGRLEAILHREFLTLEAEDSLEAVLPQLGQAPWPLVPVMFRGRLAGILLLRRR